MYVKLFASLYQGTLRGKAHEILVFTNMLAHCDKEGFVDKHFRAIADEVGLTVEQVHAAVAILEAPDEESRSPEEQGRRIIRVNDSRAWGWRVVNYGKYREIRNDADRREQNRKAQERWREKHKPAVSSRKPRVITNKQSKPIGEGEAEGKGQGQEEASEQGKAPASRSPQLPVDEGEWLSSLQGDVAYAHIPVLVELSKMQRWCIANRKEPSRKRFINWLNRIEKPLAGGKTTVHPQQRPPTGL